MIKISFVAVKKTMVHYIINNAPFNVRPQGKGAGHTQEDLIF